MVDNSKRICGRDDAVLPNCVDIASEKDVARILVVLAVRWKAAPWKPAVPTARR